MENYLYTCEYCSKQYKPNKRKKQKYCSSSCRVRAFKIRNSSNTKVSIKSKENAVEKMSFAGVGNTVAGVMAVNLATSLLTKNENKPATKKDLNNLIATLKQRYYPIANMPFRQDGAKPYYDLQTKEVIYLKNPFVLK